MKKIVYTILSLSPALTLAAEGTFNVGYFDNILDLIKRITKAGVPILFAAAVIIFFYTILRYILAAGEKPEDASKRRGAIVWSLIAIAVMASVWGLVAFLQNIFGVSSTGGTNINPPTINGL